MVNLARKIAEGYNLATRNFEETIKQGRINPFIADNHKELGGMDYIYLPSVRFGGVLAAIRHPILAYQAERVNSSLPQEEADNYKKFRKEAIKA